MLNFKATQVKLVVAIRFIVIAMANENCLAAAVVSFVFFFKPQFVD